MADTALTRRRCAAQPIVGADRLVTSGAAEPARGLTDTASTSSSPTEGQPVSGWSLHGRVLGGSVIVRG